ncbi:hypothetical protein GGI42DRAFT_71748 [Trichoderma sp. SZMC 28013]
MLASSTALRHIVAPTSGGGIGQRAPCLRLHLHRAAPEHCARLGMTGEARKNQKKKNPMLATHSFSITEPPTASNRFQGLSTVLLTGTYIRYLDATRPYNHGRKLRFWATQSTTPASAPYGATSSFSSILQVLVPIFFPLAPPSPFSAPLSPSSAVVRSSRPRAATPGAGQIASPVTAIGRSVNVCKALRSSLGIVDATTEQNPAACTVHARRRTALCVRWINPMELMPFFVSNAIALQALV